MPPIPRTGMTRLGTAVKHPRAIDRSLSSLSSLPILNCRSIHEQGQGHKVQSTDYSPRNGPTPESLLPQFVFSKIRTADLNYKYHWLARKEKIAIGEVL